jgi:hypothetical protein
MTMGAMIVVKAKDKSTPVPREDNSRRYIGEEPVVVERSTYYIRRLMHDELVQLTGEEEKKVLEAIAAKAEKEAAAEKKPAATNKGKE